MRVLFMGTPEFAAVQLRALWEHREEKGLTVVGTLCQPDKPKGRGYKLIPPPVKEYALSVGIPVYQPATLRDEAFASLLASLDPELIVVAAYGKILPPSVLAYPKYGCVNVHGSLLPAYRGAPPIQRAIMDGCTETGVTLMYMADGVDTGDMIAKAVLPIGENEDFGTLYASLADAGAELLLSALEPLENGTAPRTPQEESGATYAAKIEKEDCILDFSAHSARELHNRIRALSPAPLASAVLLSGEKRTVLKPVSSVVVEEDGEAGVPGTVLSADAKRGVITVACRRGILGIMALVPEGRGKMNAGDFLRGRKLSPEDRFV